MRFAQANRDIIKAMLHDDHRPLDAGQTVVVHKGDELVSLDGFRWHVISEQLLIPSKVWALDGGWITPYVLLKDSETAQISVLREDEAQTHG